MAVAFVVLWLPYIAGTGLQERFAAGGVLGPALVLLSLLLAWPIARLLAGRGRMNPFGLKLERKVPVLLLFGIAAMIGFRALAIWLAGLSGIAELSPLPPFMAVAGVLPVALALGAIPALAEDIITRGFPLFAMRSKLSAPVVVLLSATLYVLNHLWRFDWGISEQVRLFCMGLAYAIAAVRFRSLWAAFGLHLGWNVAGSVLPVEIASVDGFRLLGAAVHLLVAVLLLASFAWYPKWDRMTVSDR